MAYRCDDCGSDNIIETVIQNINTDAVVDSVDDSVRCQDCLSRKIYKEK